MLNTCNKCYFKEVGCNHSPLQLAVSFVGFYPGNWLYEAAGVPGKGWARFAGICVYFFITNFLESSHVCLYSESAQKFHKLQNMPSIHPPHSLYLCSTFVWYFQLSSVMVRYFLSLVRLDIVSMSVLGGHACLPFTWHPVIHCFYLWQWCEW